MVVPRTILGIKKLIFCIKISPDFSSFIKLVWNTKKYTWYTKANLPISNGEDQPLQYRLTLASSQRLIRLRTLRGDIQIFYDIFWRSIYQIPQSHLSKARTIVDLGAHIGMSTLYFRLKAPGATIYSVEPDEENFQVLLNNLDPEIRKKEVIPIHAALAGKNETIYLRRSRLGHNTSISPTDTAITVAGVDMQDLLAKYKIEEIDILKVDIEGAENLLFTGDTSWLGIVRNILIEIHSPGNLLQFQNVIRSYAFQTKKLNVDHEDVYWAFRSG